MRLREAERCRNESLDVPRAQFAVKVCIVTDSVQTQRRVTYDIQLTFRSLHKIWKIEKKRFSEIMKLYDDTLKKLEDDSFNRRIQFFKRARLLPTYEKQPGGEICVCDFSDRLKELVVTFDRERAGLEWIRIGIFRPLFGDEVRNEVLSTGLMKRLDDSSDHPDAVVVSFTTSEWEQFGIARIEPDMYVRVGDAYFKPGVLDEKQIRWVDPQKNWYLLKARTAQIQLLFEEVAKSSEAVEAFQAYARYEWSRDLKESDTLCGPIEGDRIGYCEWVGREEHITDLIGKILSMQPTESNLRDRRDLGTSFYESQANLNELRWERDALTSKIHSEMQDAGKFCNNFYVQDGRASFRCKASSLDDYGSMCVASGERCTQTYGVQNGLVPFTHDMHGVVDDQVLHLDGDDEQVPPLEGNGDDGGDISQGVNDASLGHNTNVVLRVTDADEDVDPPRTFIRFALKRNGQEDIEEDKRTIERIVREVLEREGIGHRA